MGKAQEDGFQVVFDQWDAQGALNCANQLAFLFPNTAVGSPLASLEARKRHFQNLSQAGLGHFLADPSRLERRSEIMPADTLDPIFVAHPLPAVGTDVRKSLDTLLTRCGARIDL